MSKERLAYLLKAYFNKTATAAERREFLELLEHSENDEPLKRVLTELWEQHSSNSQPISEHKGEEMLTSILQEGRRVQPHQPAAPKPVVRLWLKTAAAAILLFAVAGASFWLLNNPEQKETAAVKKTIPAVSPIVPGGNKAVLTLADGSNILLDSTNHGTLTKQGNASVINLSSAVLTYNDEESKAQETIYNMLATPKGGQYRLVLTDGTKVWLNASSSIRFPVAFSGKERKVEVTGEAYFEVAKNPAMPFKIDVRDATVQVLGTHFNIMAYEDESSMNTTLLEGSVKVSKGTQYKIIKPGQEVKITPAGAMKVDQADVEAVMAWKNGWFQFSSWDIEKIMRQIARWYDIEVVYEGKIPSGHFSGIVSRDNNIMQVLQIMQNSVGFKIEGRTIIVFEKNS